MDVFTLVGIYILPGPIQGLLRIMQAGVSKAVINSSWHTYLVQKIEFFPFLK